MMNIAILHASYDGSTVPFKDLDPACDPSRYLPGPVYTHFHIRKATAVRQVIDLARQHFDVVINLCDGVWDEDRAGIEVVQALERLGVLRPLTPGHEDGLPCRGREVSGLL